MPLVHLSKDENSSTLRYADPSNWEDLRFPAAGINPPGAVSDPDIDQTDGALLFDAGGTEIIMGMAQMPHSWLEGSALHPHLHWSPVDANAGNVLWRLEYQMAKINGSFPGAWTAVDALEAAGGDAEKHQYAEFAAIDTLGNPGVSMMIKWRISRIGGDASDTYAADAKLLEFDFHYQIASVGSGEEYRK